MRVVLPISNSTTVSATFNGNPITSTRVTQNQPDGPFGSTYTYDTVGNSLTLGSTTTYVHGAYNMLLGGSTWTYQHDDNGNL